MESWRLPGATSLMKCLLTFLTRCTSALIGDQTQRSMRGLVVFWGVQMILATVSIPWDNLQNRSAPLEHASNRWGSIPKGLVGLATINRRESHGLFSLSEWRLRQFRQQWKIIMPVCRGCVLWTYYILRVFLLHRWQLLLSGALCDMLKPLNPRQWHTLCVLSVW